MHTVAEAAAALGLSEASIISLLRTHDPDTGTTRLVRWQPDEGPPIRDIRITDESLKREMKRRGLA
jgi:hypothetical protein